MKEKLIETKLHPLGYAKFQFCNFFTPPTTLDLSLNEPFVLIDQSTEN